jgi:hypothetical protein
MTRPLKAETASLVYLFARIIQERSWIVYLTLSYDHSQRGPARRNLAYPSYATRTHTFAPNFRGKAPPTPDNASRYVSSVEVILSASETEPEP